MVSQLNEITCDSSIEAHVTLMSVKEMTCGIIYLASSMSLNDNANIPKVI